MKVLGTFILLLALAVPTVSHAADMMRWDAERDRVDASIETWTVPQLLRRVSAITGWQVLIEPGIDDKISARFKDKSSGEALQRLLGKLNFALAPDTNGNSKLYVFRTSRAEATETIAP